MTEYLELGHLELADTLPNHTTFYLPYHPVFKANSSTTEVRVVFDGSAHSSGLSLNDILLNCQKVQPDVFNILLRFRMHCIAMTAVVEKMYLQVLVEPHDRDLLRILFRSNPAEPLKDYRLCTLTHGTKSAFYLATRCLRQIGLLEHDLSTQQY